MASEKSYKTAVRLVILGLFLPATLLNLWGNFTGVRWMVLVSKPLLMSSLALGIFLFLKGSSVWSRRCSTLVAALLFGCLGDILLMLDGTAFFLSGMAAFFIGHFLYLCTMPSPFRGRNASGRILSVALLAVMLLAFIRIALALGIPGAMGICVCIYACAFAFLIHAALTAAVMERSWLMLFTGLAFALFAFSDLLVASRQFSVFTLPYHGFWVMATYIDAQLAAAVTLAHHEIEYSKE